MKRQRYFVAVVLLSFVLPAASLAQEEGAEEAKKHKEVFVWKGVEGRGYLGVQFVPMTPELRRHFGVPEDAGVLISRVEASSPAEAAGVLVGDILMAVDKKRVSGPDLYRVIGDKKEGDLVRVELWREGAARTVDVIIAERERRAIDLARYRFLPHAPDIEIEIPEIHFDQEAMEALEDAMEALSDRKGELREKLQRLEELDLQAIQKRMQEVEERLRMLERELAEEGVTKER